MSDIEDRLRVTLRAQPDPRDSAEVWAKVRARLHHQKRNRTAAALVVAALAIAAVSIPTAAVLRTPVPPAHGPAASVPWAEDPVALQAARHQQLAPFHTTAKWPPCLADQLSAAPSGMPGGSMGKLTYLIRVTNTSSRSCTLAGHPRDLTGVRVDSGRVPLHASTTPFVTDAFTAPANIAPGHSAWFAIVTSSDCPWAGRGLTDPFVGVEFRSGPGQPVPVAWSSGQTIDLVCGSRVTPFGTLRPEHPARVPLDALTAHITLPATVKASTTLTYHVTLANGSGHVVRLDDPCPAYTQSLAGTGALSVAETGADLLNCIGRVVPAHSALRFTMRIQTPAKAGTAALRWAIPGTTVRADSTLTVSPAPRPPGHPPGHLPTPAPYYSPGPGSPHQAAYTRAMAEVRAFLAAWEARGANAAARTYLQPGYRPSPGQPGPRLVAARVQGFRPVAWTSANRFTLAVDLYLRFAGDTAAWGQGTNERFITFIKGPAAHRYLLSLATGP